ncbi:MAG TPA: arginine deiminase-related protein [Lacipirellulaceae bacterium]|nr:arginine deiminase-related protein [Lacipirellulaceae bacterium]
MSTTSPRAETLTPAGTRAAHILMCPPRYYGIEYEINPWMNTERQADHELATRQWAALQAALADAGASISTLEPVPGLPDLVFTANAALVYGRRAVISRFKHPQRQGEEAHFRAWLADHGWTVADTPAGCSFEGAGDALFCGDTLYAGYRRRSDVRGHQQIAAQLGVRVLPLELVDPYYYHLDTCFCPLEAGAAIYFPAAFDDYGRRVLAAHIPTLIEAVEAEARSFACNAVVVGRTVITNEGCPLLHEQLRSAGFTPVATPLGEFVKAGGSAKCLTLRLDGEEAAAWRAAAPLEP